MLRLLAHCTYTVFVRFTCLLHESCNERISETVKIDVSKDTAEIEETIVVEEIPQKAAVEETVLPAVEPEAKMETAVEQPLKQASVVEEIQPEDFVEPLESESTTEETHPTEVAYDENLPKKSIVVQTVKTEECVAELSLRKPVSPEEEEEAEGFISILKEEKSELLQPSSVEEDHPEDSVEQFNTELTTEEVHPSEVVYDEISSEANIAVKRVKTEECAAELSIQQPTLPEVEEAEVSISLPKEEKMELLQPSSVEETHPEDFVEPFATEFTTEEVQPTEVTYEEILPKESIAVQTVTTEECVAELSIQQPTSPEVAEAESSVSLPKDEKEGVTVERESAKPEVSASLDVIQPTKVEETLTVPSADVQKAADATEVEIKVPKPVVEEDVSLALAMQPKSEDFSAEESLKMPSPTSVEESASIESRKPESPTEEASLTLTTQRSPTEDEESISLSLRQPQDEEDTDLTLSLRKPEAGMTAVAALACMTISSVDQCLVTSRL